MRRFRYLVSAALLLVGAVFFFMQHQSEAYNFEDDSLGTGRSGTDTSSSLNDDQVIPGPPQSEAPPDGFPQSEQSSQDMFPSDNFPSSPEPPFTPNVPVLDAPDNIPPPAQPQPTFEAEFPFQEDLKLDLPVETFEKASHHKPHNYDPNGPKSYTYATFMATRNPSIKDPYFMAIHSLIYRILWSPRSRTEKYPFVVFVADFVTPQQRQLLSGAGAIVRELAPLEWTPNVPGVQHRWKDLFAKLNMWNETEFSRILFLDADAFPLTSIDSMFDIAPVQDCIESKLAPDDDYFLDGTSACEPYVFAGVPQDPGDAVDININVGSMVFTPSERMHMRLLQNYVKTDRYNCLMAEQAFLNWQFNINSAFPATALEREYGGAFPSEQDEGKLKVVHEKLWQEERRWMKEEWTRGWNEMLEFYQSPAFFEERARDGVGFALDGSVVA